ncbi:MAG TPA: MFS transporter, partial [Chloroflexota bacterium]|nr:MFS transporter [Chloroflexota bacterium]
LAGLITGVANVTSSVAQPLVGILTDRGRDPRWIAIACLVAAAGITTTGLAPTFPVFLALVVLGGLGVSAFHPQGYKLTGLHAGRQQAAATSWFLVGGNVGVALGPLLGTAAVLHFGLPGTTALLIPGLVLTTTLWWLVPRWTGYPPTSQRRLSGRAARMGESLATGVVNVSVSVPPAVLGLTARRRLVAVVVLVVLVAVRATLSTSLTSFIPLYYVNVAGLGEDTASHVLAGMLLAGALATVAGGYIADRLGRLRVLAASLAAVPPCLFAFVAAQPGSLPSTAALWVAGALITSSFSITVVLAQELWYERRALASGVIVGFAFGMGGLLVPLVGAIADRWGLRAAFSLLVGLPIVPLALSIFLAVLMRRRPA